VNRLTKTFLNGLIVVAPLAVTIYVFFRLFETVDTLGSQLLTPITTKHIPGVGVLLTVVFVLFIGFISRLWFSTQIIYITENLLSRFPLARTLYDTVKDTLSSLIGEERSFKQVVLVEDYNESKRIGFLTSENLSQFKLENQWVSVYLPHAMAMSGVVQFYKREQVTLLPISVEEAMRFCLSAGISSKSNKA
jgi:uncharacterized membrane protein